MPAEPKKALYVPGLTPAATSLETEVRMWLGTHPDAETPQTVPAYEDKLRALGARLVRDELTAPEVLLALSLHYLTLARETQRADLLGRGRQLFLAAQALGRSASDARVVGEALAKKGAPS